MNRPRLPSFALLLLCATTPQAHATPPAHASQRGLYFAPGVDAEVYQCVTEECTGRVEMRMWSWPWDWYLVSRDFTQWVEDPGEGAGGCLFSMGWSYRSGVGPGTALADPPTEVLHFSAKDADKGVAGLYAGPCDWSLDGDVDAGDMLAFLESFVSGNADWNLDSRTDTRDLFQFVQGFFAGDMER